MDDNREPAQPTSQRLLNFELDPKLRIIGNLKLPHQILKLLRALAIFGCEKHGDVATDGEDDGCEWLLSPTVSQLAGRACRSDRTVQGWIKLARAMTFEFFGIDEVSGGAYTFWIHWERMAGGTLSGDQASPLQFHPRSFSNCTPAISTIAPPQFLQLRGCNSEPRPLNHAESSQSLTHSASDGLSEVGERVRLPPLPVEVWEMSRTGKSLSAVIRLWWREHDLRDSGIDPDELAGAILAARESAKGNPQAYAEAALTQGLKPHWIARGRELRQDKYTGR